MVRFSFVETDKFGRIAEDLPLPGPLTSKAKEDYEKRWLAGIKQAAVDRKARATPRKPSTKPVVKIKAATKRSRQCSSAS